MSKIINDMYYTPYELATYCINKTFQIIGRDFITEIVEPSAGNGSFSSQINNCIAYDINPIGKSIIKQDFLTLNLSYMKGRLFIGNPPFGHRNTLAVKFYKQAIKYGDYIAFILPISQYNNNQQMYEFNLIYSEDLGLKKYSDVELHCCFNIYQRPDNGIYNIKPNYKLKDVVVTEYRRGGTYKKPENYDYGICAWGSLGKEINYVGQYAQENYIFIKNQDFKDEILKVIKCADWKNIYPSISSPKLQTWKIYKYLKEQIKELK